MQLLQGDCLELMRDIPDGSVDMVLCDLPYGATRNEWDTVLDNCMGSGSTGVACIETERDFIGIEKDPKIFASARCRILDAAGDIFWRGKKEVDTWRKN